MIKIQTPTCPYCQLNYKHILWDINTILMMAEFYCVFCNKSFQISLADTINKTTLSCE